MKIMATKLFCVYRLVLLVGVSFSPASSAYPVVGVEDYRCVLSHIWTSDRPIAEFCTYTTHKPRTPMSPAVDRPNTYALDRTATFVYSGLFNDFLVAKGVLRN